MDGTRQSRGMNADLTLDEAIGQVLCFGWQGEKPYTANAHAIELIDDLQVGSIILMSRNVSEPAATRAVISELQRRATLPLLVAVDQEGGLVNRFGYPLTAFPGNMALGACGPRAPELARRQAHATGRELRAVGVNWDFAPVLDVNSNPDNPIIGIRSFGEDPAVVAELGAAAVKGYQDGGVLACAKHFPGHGDTAIDSHLGLPRVHADLSRLEAVELAPFRAAVAANVATVMTTHVVFDALDPAVPATVSEPILTGLLRSRIGFTGVVVTDCLEMAAIADGMGTPAAAVAALAAGADVVTVCHTLEVQRETVRAIRHAVADGRLPERRVRESAGRVLAAKALVGAGEPTREREPWADPVHGDLERTIAAESITVVRNGGAVPIPRGARVAVASWGDVGRRLASALARLGSDPEVVDLTDADDGPKRTDATARLCGADRTILLSALPPGGRSAADRQAAWVRRLHDSIGPRLIAVAVRDPYDLRSYPAVATYVCTYGSRDCTLATLADALLGRSDARGRPPVTIV
jgi:beta-N-acetylhexosaminidase